MNPNRRWIIAVISGLLLLASPIPAASEPCCIIVVHPPPPPPSTKETGISPSSIVIYPQLPLFAAIERKTFGSSLKVEVEHKFSGEALKMVRSTQGALGLISINNLAKYKVATEANIEIVAVTINRPYYGLYTLAGGPATFKKLKGKVINISCFDALGYVYTVKALRSTGVSEKDAKFVSVAAVGPPGYIDAAKALKSGSVEATTAFIGYEAAVPEFKLKEIKPPEPIMFPSWVIYASSTTLDKETNKVIQFIKGFTKGINIVKKDRQLTRHILEKQFNISDRRVQDLIVKYIPFILPDSVRPDPEEIKLTLKIVGSIAKFKKVPVLLDQKRIQVLYQQK